MQLDQEDLALIRHALRVLRRGIAAQRPITRVAINRRQRDLEQIDQLMLALDR